MGHLLKHVKAGSEVQEGSFENSDSSSNPVEVIERVFSPRGYLLKKTLSELKFVGVRAQGACVCNFLRNTDMFEAIVLKE